MLPTQTTTFVPKICVALLVGLFCAPPVTGQAPLHGVIDREIHKGCKDYATLAAPLADDAEFCRRLYLDLTGVIPSAAELRTFFDDKSDDRRAKLVDRLLAGDASARHLQHTFQVLFMDRRPAKQVKLAEWEKFLFESFAKNKPYDQLVREILSADGADPKNRGPARFYLDRDGETDQLTKDVSRLFLGMNLHCAQCHDHPLVNAYKQDFYYGVYAFLSRGYLFTDKAKKTTVYAEKAEGNVTFQSVFVAKVTKSTGPRLPTGKEVKEPTFAKGQEYVSPVKKGERGIPKFSRREKLAELITSPDNRAFARTTVNRFWAMLLGRGIIDPVEYDHVDNPPSHPELLDAMTDQFIAHGFDIKWLMREIVLSETYQRSSAQPAGAKELDPRWFAQAQLRPLTPEQFGWSILQATGLIDAERAALGARATEAALYARLDPQVKPFIPLFGSAPGEPASNADFEATLDQTLFLKNGPQIRALLVPKAGNLTFRLGQLKDAGAIADEAFLTVFSRHPFPEERTDVAAFLDGAKDRATALQELVWALLTSAEFRFNH